MKFNLSIAAFLILIFMTTVNAKDKYFNDAILLYEKEKYEESKFLFQKNIVFNPKDFKSYYYLAKIFQIEKNDRETEKNLNTALFLKPNDEEVMYMLIDIELKKSNFSKVKELSEDFKVICSSLCAKTELINESLKDFQEKNES
jgi:tetratricopeptide (TPR) repeat protein